MMEHSYNRPSLSFASLPLELQRQIWGEAAKLEPPDGPRIHCVQEIRRRPEEAPYLSVLNSGRSQAYRVPSLLETSHEARQAGLKEYMLLPCQCVDPICWSHHVYESPSYIYFNKRHDMLRFGGLSQWHWSLMQLKAVSDMETTAGSSRIAESLKNLSPVIEVMENIRNLVLDWSVWFDLLSRETPVALHWFRYFPSLETITVLLMDPQHNLPPGRTQVEREDHLAHQVRELLPYTGRGRSFTASLLQSHIDSSLWMYGFANPGATVPRTRVMALCVDGIADDEDEESQETLRAMITRCHEDWREEHGRRFSNIV